jgi:predicted Zn-dependent protease
MNTTKHGVIVSVLIMMITLFPSTSFSAGGETSPSSNKAEKKESSNYSKTSMGRFGDVKKLIYQKEYSTAYLELVSLPLKSKDEADRQNLLGFTARKDGKLETASVHYKNALNIDPNHRGALEYQGELFLMLGQMDDALKNLQKLKKQCWIGCLELTKLEAAISNY